MDIELYLKQELNEAIRAIGFKCEESIEIKLSAPKEKDHGDLATNVAMVLSSKIKKNPREIAQSLIDNLKLDPEAVSKAIIAGPGFINFTLSNIYFVSELKKIFELQDDFGKSQIGKGERTQVEFVSANPTGPLTIGHGRQAVIGDTIARLLENAGYVVDREYYFNDAGRQMRILGDSVRLRYLELLGEKVDFPEDYYQGEYICDIARNALDEKGDSLKNNPDVEYFKNLAEKEIFRDIEQTLKRMNIAFDRYFNEKSLYENGEIDCVLETLKEKDLAYERDGAVWFRLTALGGEQDRVIVKSSGEPTYRLPDIAYHKDKMERGYDLVVDIFGSDHAATYPDVLAGIEALGYDASTVKVLIHQFVTLVAGKEKVKMSTRKANFVTLNELIDEVGIDVTRYFFINRSMFSHLNFDLTLAKTQSDENPVYYVQYAHARICSILRHAEKEGFDLNASYDLSLLSAAEEMDLIKIVLQYPQIVEAATSCYEPHRLPIYLEEVSTVYHRFQHAGKVNDAMRVVSGNVPVSLARLALCRATRIVLANGLGLLGISAPEEM